MNRRSWFSLLISLVLVDIVLMSIAWMNGELQFGLVLVFPIIVANGTIGALAIISIFATIAVLFLAPIIIGGYGTDHRKLSPSHGGAEIRSGGILMIGPIPIVFGSDVRVVRYMIVIAVAALIVLALSLVIL